ncbi:hypothetical protein F7725_017479 [Dissostichus mawsoni]|uniref:SEFIR domain-containing protein n=1 Tax=Dissostichus mawsoni TaxID=36200 RepID=A0A7J5Z561_DISMA|nr:hypothetical protein F7725_017479 [Dissostichus mawsoni]
MVSTTDLASADSDPAVSAGIVRLEVGGVHTVSFASGDHYLGQQLRDVTFSLVWLVVNPAEDRLKHRVLLAHVEVVALNNGGQLLNREIHKLLGDRNYLLKAVQDVEEDFCTLLRHVVDTHQLPDADAVPRGQLVLQEEPAALNQPRHQELVCSCQKLHHVILRHRSRVGVGIVDDEAHHLRRHPGDGVLLLFDGCPGSELFRLEGGMAAPRSFFITLSGLFLFLNVSCGSTTSGGRRANQERCGYKVQSDADGVPGWPSPSELTDDADLCNRLSMSSFFSVSLPSDCSINYPLGKHVIHEVANVSFSHLACEDQAAVIVHWSASPLGIEHIKGFRVYLEDKNPEGKQCQHLLLKDPRQLNCSYKNTAEQSDVQRVTFDTDYMVRVVPFPTLMNESFFPPSFLRTNSCEVLLGSDNLVCKPYWKPKTLNVSQLGSNLHDVNQYRTTCILKDVTPGTYTIELRDDSNTTRRQTQYHVSQENIYSQLDEESSESSNQSAALNPEKPWPRPKVFICYSNRDCPKHIAVVLDMWEHLEMCKSQMSWLSRQLDESDFIITICSKGLRYYVEKKSRRGKTPVSRRSNSSSSSSPIGGSGSDLFIVGVAMIAEKLRLANQSEGGGSQELQRYMTLMDQLPQLFSRLHSSQSSLSDRESQPHNVSRRNYFRSRSGRSLYVSICNMHQHISQNPDWFEKQLAPSASSASSSKHPPVADPNLPPKPSCASSSSQSVGRCDSGLVLNEVVVNTPSLEGGEGALGGTCSCWPLAPVPAYTPAPALVPVLDSVPVLDCHTAPCPYWEALQGPLLAYLAGPLKSPPPPAPLPPSCRTWCVLSTLRQKKAATHFQRSPPLVIRASMIQLSIPLMDGLSHDQADSSSLADSESSSSGLGDEEPPAVMSLRCSAATVCKAELHHHHHLEHADGLAPVATL